MAVVGVSISIFGVVLILVAIQFEIRKLPDRIAEKMIEKLCEEEKRKQMERNHNNDREN